MEGHDALAPLVQWINQMDLAGAIGRFASWLASTSASLVRGWFWQLVTIVLTFYLLFYFLRDRKLALAWLHEISPLSEAETTRLFARIAERHPDFTYNRFRYQPALDRLLEEQPVHLLAPEYASWPDLLLAAADDVLAGLKEKGLAPDEAAWGRQNTARIRHPLSRALPGFLAKHLDMPADPLPGDNDVPRVQTPAFGASQRFVVSPGRESEGIYHMPGGQSGHPLSPYYRAGHDAWVKGEPTPFLPGPAQHTLILTP